MNTIVLMFPLSVLSACGGSDHPSAPLAAEQRAVLEKAKAVEVDLKKEAQNNQQAIEKQMQ